MILRHVGDHGNIVVRGPDASQQDATAGNLQDGQVDPRLTQRLSRAAEARIIARDFQLLVAVDAVRAGVRDGLSGGPSQVRQQPNSGGLSIGAGDRHHRDSRLRDAGRHSRIRGLQTLDRLADQGVDPPVIPKAGIEQASHLSPKGLGHALAAPGKGDHHLLGLRSDPAADGDLAPARLGNRPGDVGGQPRQVATPVLGGERARRPGRGQLQPFRLVLHPAGR